MYQSHVIPGEVYWVEVEDHGYLVRMAFEDTVLTHLVCQTQEEAENLCRKLRKHYGIAAQRSALRKTEVRDASSL
jgi:hypothetical protein